MEAEEESVIKNGYSSPEIANIIYTSGTTGKPIGGEVLSDTHVSLFKKRNNNVKLINGYGPTENTTFTTTYEIPENFDSIPIGKPINNTQVFIVRDGKLCGIKVLGELWVAGSGVAKGYLNFPLLTKEKFLKNPFGDGIVYRTGDMGYWEKVE